MVPLPVFVFSSILYLQTHFTGCGSFLFSIPSARNPCAFPTALIVLPGFPHINGRLVQSFAAVLLAVQPCFLMPRHCCRLPAASRFFIGRAFLYEFITFRSKRSASENFPRTTMASCSSRVSSGETWGRSMSGSFSSAINWRSYFSNWSSPKAFP